MSPRSVGSAFSVKESFLPLPENRLAYVAVMDLLEPGPPLRPGRLAFISGPSGVGKSLLVREFLRQGHGQTPQEAKTLLTASQWAADLAEAAQNQTIDQFQHRHRSLELLICEDVAAIAGREESQQQLAAVVDEILGNGGRVLLTSAVSAGSLTRFSARLINRFQGGVTAHIALPDLHSRILLLQHFAAARQIPLPLAVAKRVAEALAVSPRELLSIVIQLETLARQRKLPLNLALAEQYLLNEVPPLPATISEVARAVSRQFGVPLSGLRGKKRVQGVVLPRQCAMFLARELTDLPLLAIAQFFGRRHHSTVVHACKRMESALPGEPALRQHLAQIRAALGTPP